MSFQIPARYLVRWTNKLLTRSLLIGLFFLLLNFNGNNKIHAQATPVVNASFDLDVNFESPDVGVENLYYFDEEDGFSRVNVDDTTTLQNGTNLVLNRRSWSMNGLTEDSDWTHTYYASQGGNNYSSFLYDYTEPGNYTVKLEVEYKDTITNQYYRDTAELVIIVRELVSDFSIDSYGPMYGITNYYTRVNTQVQYWDRSAAGNATITSWSWDLDGNGTGDQVTQNATASYSTVGTYNVSLTISDGIYTSTKTKAIQVLPASSVNSNFTINYPYHASSTTSLIEFGFVGDTINFDWVDNYPGGVSLNTLRWDFNGDGSWDAMGDTVANHAYDKAGYYNVTFQIVDSLGRITTTTQQVIIVDSYTVELYKDTEVTANISEFTYFTLLSNRFIEMGIPVFFYVPSSTSDSDCFDETSNDSIVVCIHANSSWGHTTKGGKVYLYAGNSGNINNSLAYFLAGSSTSTSNAALLDIGVHEFSHIFNAMDTYFMEDARVIQSPYSDLFTGDPSVPSITNWTGTQFDVMGTPDNVNTNRAHNFVNKTFLKNNTNLFSWINSSQTGAPSHIFVYDEGFPLAELVDRVTSSGMVIDLPNNGQIWSGCEAYPAINAVYPTPQTVFDHRYSDGFRNATGVPNDIEDIVIFKEGLPGGVEEYEHTSLIYLECLTSTNQVHQFWINGLVFLQAYNRAQEVGMDVDNIVIQPIITCSNSTNFCNLKTVDPIRGQLRYYGLYVEQLHNYDSLLKNLEKQLNGNDARFAKNALILINPDGSYKLLSNGFVSEEQLIYDLRTYAATATDAQLPLLNYESIRKVVQNEADINGRTLGLESNSRDFFLITDKDANANTQSLVINAGATNKTQISTLYVGSGSIPSTYTAVANGTFGKALDAGLQQDVSERLDDLLRYNKQNHYTDFSYEVTSGFEGEVPLTVTFDSNSYNGYTPTTYAWDFDGDGDVDSTLANPSYTYTQKGVYDVKLYTTNRVQSDTKVNYDIIDGLTGTMDPVTQWGKNQTYGDTQDQAFDKDGNMYMIGNLWADIDLGNGVVLEEFSDAGDAVLVKYDANGKALWGKVFGGTMYADLYHLELDKDGNAYVVGDFRGWSESQSVSLYIDGVSYPRIVTPASQAIFDETEFIAKINASGSLAWVHQLQTDRDVVVNELMIDDQGNVSMAGTFENTLKVSNGAQLTVPQVAGSPNYWPKAIYIMKLNTLGQYQWGRVSYGAFNTGGTKSAVMDSNGDILVYGTHRSTDTNIYDYPVFLRVNGATGVANVTNLPDTEVRMDQMEIDGEDNLYFRGKVSNPGQTLLGEDMSLTGDYQDYIAKFDSNHNLLWSYQKGLEYGNFTLMNVKDNGEVYFAVSLYNRNNEDEVASFQTVSGTKNFVGVGDWSALLGGLTKGGGLKWIESYFPMNEGWSTQYERNMNYSDIYSIAFGPRNTVALGGEYYTTMRNPDGAQFNMAATWGGGFMYKMGVGNLFGEDVEGWTSTNTSAPITHGSAKITNASGGSEVYLKAPIQYRGDQSDKYGGKLSFDLVQTVSTNQLATWNDVIIEGYGMKISYDIASPGTTGTHYELLLNEFSGWRKAYTGEPVTGDEMRKVLSAIDSLSILANYSSDANEVSLTNITFGERLNPVVANFTPSVTTGVAPLTVNFTNTSENETAWGWDFNNDGIIDSELENPSYTFNTVGTYVVRLIASGAGDTNSKEVTIVVGTTSVTAGFSGTPVSGYAPLSVNFTDSSTASNTTITSRSWDFNNDGVVDSTAQNPSYTYTTPGTYTVKLTVSNGTISDDEVKTAYITVNNPLFSCSQVEYTTIDTYARGGTYANNNYGTAVTMYTKDGGDNWDRQSFMRFDLTGTDYSTITSAKLRLHVDDIAMSFSAQPNVRFYDVTDNTWTETGLTWNNKPTLGSTIVTWNALDSQEKTWLEIDMTSYIQAELNGDRIINIGTWDVNASDEEVEFDTRESTKKPFLEITGVSGDCLPPMAEGTNELDRQITTTYDDGGEDLEYAGSGDMMRTRVDLFLTRAWGTDDFETAVRFQNITIPQGATIKSAYIEVVSYKLHGSAVNMNIYGHDVDNAPALEYIVDNITSRAKTTAYYNWTNLGVWNQNSAYRTGDLKDVVQEIVDRGGWVSGNAMMFIINGTGDRSIYSYDGSTTYAPKLHIEYDL